MREVDPRALGRRIRQRRKAIPLSQTDLAEACGMSQQGIVNLEQGIVKRPRGLIELAAALNTTPEWLLWEEGPEVVRIKHQGNEIAAVMRDLAPEQLPAALMYLHRLSRRKSRQRAS